MMIIDMPTLKQYLANKGKPAAKSRRCSKHRCAEVDALRLEKSLTIADACRMVGVSTETYYRYKKAQ